MTNSYIVTAKNGQNINKVAEEIQSLSAQQKKSVDIGNKFEFIGVLQMSCKDDFAAAVRKLPSVLGVERENTFGINDIQDKKGPKL